MQPNQPALLNANINFVTEDEAVALQRYSGFGANFFRDLYAIHPKLHNKFQFFRDARSDDVWAICENSEFAFGVQLDPDIEVICIWNRNWHDEIGTWFKNPIQEAIKILSKKCLPP